MTIYARPIARVIKALEEFPQYAEMLEDAADYESQPPSFVNPTLSVGQSAGGSTLSIFLNGFDCDYKWSGGDGSGDGMAVFAIPYGGDYPTDAIFAVYETGAAAKGWTHAHVDLTPGYYYIGCGVIQHGTTPVFGHIDNLQPAPSILLTGHGPNSFIGRVNDIPPANISFMSHPPKWGPTFAEIPTPALIIAGRNPSAIWTVKNDKLATAQMIYKCTLTGVEDGLSDLTLPMKSFQARLRDGDPSYLSCVIPDSTTYAPLVAARTNGEIIIYSGYKFADGTEQVEEIIRVNYDSLQINRGANSDSLTITGYKTITSSSPKDWTVTGVSFFGQTAEGKRRIRAKSDHFIRCGDTCIYGTGGNDYFVVGAITCWVVASTAEYFMEASEA